MAGLLIVAAVVTAAAVAVVVEAWRRTARTAEWNRRHQQHLDDIGWEHPKWRKRMWDPDSMG